MNKRFGHPGIPIIATDKDGNETRFPSGRAAAEALNIQYQQISRACITDRLCHGYYFRKENEE